VTAPRIANPTMSTDTSNEFTRREARATQIEHVLAMGQMREIVARLFGGDASESAAAKADFATGGVNRRGFLKIGGLSVATAAIFAACGSDDEGSGTTAGGEGDEDGGMSGNSGDLTIVRTAASLELLAVDVYQKAIDSGLVKTAAIGDAAKLFQEQHREHAELFNGAAKQMGGEPFEKANPEVMKSLEPALAGLKDELGVVKLAYDLENIAASTYFSTIGAFNDAKLNQAAMSVGGVEARHVAVLASVMNQPAVPKAFWTADGAVEAGTGV